MPFWAESRAAAQQKYLLMRQPRWVCPLSETPGWEWPFSMAAECFRSKTSNQAGIPLADGRSCNRPAESHTSFQREKGLLILCKKPKLKNFFSLQNQSHCRYPQPFVDTKTYSCNSGPRYSLVWISAYKSGWFFRFLFHSSIIMVFRQNDGAAS